MTRSTLDWAVSGHARRLLTVAVLAVLAAALSRRPLVLALAGPPLLLLVTGATGARPRHVKLDAHLAPSRCLEGDDVELTVHATTAHPGTAVRATLHHPAHVKVLDAQTTTSLGSGATTVTWQLRPTRWGRWSVGPVSLQVRDPGRLLQATCSCPAAKLTVYPQLAPLARLVVPARLLPRPGLHSAHTIGSGLEFNDLRPYVPGDRRRDIHWPSSQRHGQLLVVQRCAELTADVVLAVDAFSDVRRSLERSVRGCAALADAYLRQGDQVGLAVLGGSLHTMRPEPGQRMLYRILDAVLAVRLDDSVVTPQVARIPPRNLPPRSLVVLFSPLLDERAVGVVQDLHTRGCTVVVVDVLSTKPALPRHPSPHDELTLRVWRLDRQAQRQHLRDHGIVVLRWTGERELGEVFAPAAVTGLVVRR